MSYIAKAVYYSNDYGVSLFVGRKTDETKPTNFAYYFELDIDPTKDMTMGFQKRGRYLCGFTFLLNPQCVEENHCALMLADTVTVSSYTFDLFETHIRSDAVVFSYTAKDGTQKEFRFSLAGFNEHYLEQFI